MVDDVFRALGDPNRRTLLDALFREDGQTLRDLCSQLPDMTRQGVMSHLRVLEAAGLVSTRRVGRETHHYLNPVPIRDIHDRWIDKYRAPTTSALTDIKRRVERRGAEMNKPTHVYTTHIAGTPAMVWAAITDGDMTRQYFYGTTVVSSWEVGASVQYLYPDGTIAADGAVIAIEPDRRLEMTFHARWDPDLEAEGPVRQVWILEGAAATTVLTVETWDMAPDSKTFQEFAGGLPYIVSGLKSLVETGSGLPG